tara:strand:- start:3713 stop:3994 length:282 start_codon:yes stop_codon:yes gene_type:complete
MDDDIRLQRIEDKLDKMSDAIVALARVEEKITDLEVRRAEGHERLNRLSNKLDAVDTHITSMRERMAVMTKIMWAVGTATVAAVLTHVQEMLV